MPNASMASIGEIYSLPESQTRDLQRCTDQNVISVLRKYRSSLYQYFKDQPRIDQEIRWYLVNSIITSKIAAMEGWMTDHGTWSPRKLVSIPNTFQGKSCNSPKFVGTKTTMELKPTDGSKAVLGMTRYNLLTTREDGDGLDLDEDLALCHVYPLEGKNKADRKRNITSEQFKEFAPPELDGPEQVMSKLDFQNMYPIDTGDYHIDDLVPSKRPRSDHWDSFTKIYTKDPKRMYAACNHCDTMLKLKGGPSCGTGSLKHHNDSCRCKPKQEQLPDSSYERRCLFRRCLFRRFRRCLFRRCLFCRFRRCPTVLMSVGAYSVGACPTVLHRFLFRRLRRRPSRNNLS